MSVPISLSDETSYVLWQRIASLLSAGLCADDPVGREAFEILAVRLELGARRHRYAGLDDDELDCVDHPVPPTKP